MNSFPLIQIKQLGPKSRGGRVRAVFYQDANKTWSAMIEYNDALTSTDNYKLAVEKLIATWPFGDDYKIHCFAHDAKATYAIVIPKSFEF